jgi:hypothetical protein
VLVGPYAAGPYAEGDYEVTLPIGVLAAVKPHIAAPSRPSQWAKWPYMTGMTNTRSLMMATPCCAMAPSSCTAAAFEGMRKAGRLAAEILDALAEVVRPALPPARSTMWCAR